MGAITDFIKSVGDILYTLLKAEGKLLAGMIEGEAKCLEYRLKRLCHWCWMLLFYVLLLLTGVWLLCGRI